MCHCGKMFTDEIETFRHFVKDHRYPRHVLLHKTLAQMLSSDFSAEGADSNKTTAVATPPQVRFLNANSLFCSYRLASLSLASIRRLSVYEITG